MDENQRNEFASFIKSIFELKIKRGEDSKSPELIMAEGKITGLTAQTRAERYHFEVIIRRLLADLQAAGEKIEEREELISWRDKENHSQLNEIRNLEIELERRDKELSGWKMSSQGIEKELARLTGEKIFFKTCLEKEKKEGSRLQGVIAEIKAVAEKNYDLKHEKERALMAIKDIIAVECPLKPVLEEPPPESLS